MNPYYLSLFNLCTLVYFISISRIDKKILLNILIAIYSFLAALFINLRDYQYGDTKAYYDYYVSDFDFVNFEPLYEIINYLFRIFFPTDPYYMFVFISFLTVFLINYSLLKILNTKEALITIWIFSSLFSYYYYTFEVLRDGLAFSVFLLSVVFYLKEKIYIYFFVILLSGSIHYTYLIFIFLPIFAKIEDKKKILVLFIMVYFISTFLMTYITSLDLTSNVILYKLAHYEVFTNESKTIFIRAIFFIIGSFFVYKYSPSQRFTDIYLFIILIIIASLSFDEINRRFLFKVTLFLLIPIVLFTFKYRLLKVLVFLIILYFNVFLINYNAMYGLLNYKPYFNLAY